MGVSVVNALSARVEVEIDRDGERHYMDFEDGGKLKTKLDVIGEAPTRPHRHHRPLLARSDHLRRDRRSGPQTLLERFQMMAFLNEGLEIRFRDERPGDDPEPVVYQYDGGIATSCATSTRPRRPLFSKVGYFEQAEDEQEVEIAFQWNTGYNTDGLHSFANGITTIEGGMHEEGFKKSLTNVVNSTPGPRASSRRRTRTSRARTSARASPPSSRCSLSEPQFEGQTKGKLGNVSDALAGRAGHQREAGRLARGEPHRGHARSCNKADPGRPGPPGRPQRP